MAATSKLGLFRRHPWVKRALLLGFTFCLFAGLGLAFASWSLVCRGGACPSVEVLEDYRPRQTSKLYAADGRFIAELGLERRTLIALDDIPKQVQAAFVITEDKRFYRHSGIDRGQLAVHLGGIGQTAGRLLDAGRRRQDRQGLRRELQCPLDGRDRLGHLSGRFAITG